MQWCLPGSNQYLHVLNTVSRSSVTQLVRVEHTARVVEAVLTAWRAMEVYQDFQACCLCPVKSLAKYSISTLHVRVALNRRNGPVTNGNADEIETKRRNLVEVILSYVSLHLQDNDAAHTCVIQVFQC